MDSNLNQNFSSADRRMVAFFDNEEQAYKAVSDLHNAGFNSEEIGLITRGGQFAATQPSSTSSPTERDSYTSGSETNDESVWEKIKHFFSGDEPQNEPDRVDPDSSLSGAVDYRESAAQMNWDSDRSDYYYRGIGKGGALVTVTGSRLEEARQILESDGGDLRENGFQQAVKEDVREDNIGTEDYLFQLRGEVLRTFKDRVQRGEVRVRKEVVTENQTVSVPVTREELVIERRPVSDQNVAASGEIGTDPEVRIPLSEERARVEKSPVVNEEVRVGKRQVQNTEQVSDTVHHEELRVDKEGDVTTDVPPKKVKKPAA